MKKLIVVKFGGSVITHKDSLQPRPRLTVIKKLAQQVKQILDDNKYQLILVHGAGSFGHPLANKYSLNKGMNTNEQKLGFVQTQYQMIQLNQIILSSLLKQNIPATSIIPHSFITQSAGKIQKFDYKIITNALKNDLIPVLFGDGILDNQWGCSILSGDVIVSYLAKKFKADKVIFLSNVDGIFNRDPNKFKTAQLIPLIDNQNLDQVLKKITIRNSHDVTGEMIGKIISIRTHLPGIKVIITNGLRWGILVDALGQEQQGTKLLLR